MYQIEKEDISAIIKTLEITNVLGKTFFITEIGRASCRERVYVLV